MYHLWSGKHENETIIERLNFKIVDLDISSLELLVNGYITFECKLNNMDLLMRISEKSFEEYVDLEKLAVHEFVNCIQVAHDKSNLSRKDKRKELTYPHFISMDICPSSYESIKFVKACKEIIKIGKEG
jgi:hypothetical protein